ncbi:hypothetical protein HK099_001064 [Clydaea vesicula]|uniref:SAPS-domain-containing protein n=1 Tax=Clydaea vesicula TaxID=447962 RepID=A0AAD5U599_9FUNG|nr:hypothetical protein HK099_001064 [Clydaea vesicula]
MYNGKWEQFWKFGFHSATAIDSALEKEGLTMLDLFEEDELLQECKSHNTKLIEFIIRPENLLEILNCLTLKKSITDNQSSDQKESAHDRNRRYKYAYYACEVLCCEVFAICDAFVQNTKLLDTFWQILDDDSLDLVQVLYFSKANITFLEKKPVEMIAYIKTQPNIISKLLKHISNSPITDLILKLIALEESPQAAGVIDWLCKQDLIKLLVERLSAEHDSEMHNIAAQAILDVIAISYQNAVQLEMLQPGMDLQSAENDGNALIDQLKSEAIMNQLVDYMLDKGCESTSILTNGINIIIELIRRYCSEIEQAEYSQHHYQNQTHKQGPIQPSQEKLDSLATDLNELLRVLGKRLGAFAELLANPRITVPVETTIGNQIPLGAERLKTCELFAEILHLQYLYTSSPLFERLVNTDKKKTTAEQYLFPAQFNSDSKTTTTEEGGLDDDVTDKMGDLTTEEVKNTEEDLVVIQKGGVPSPLRSSESSERRNDVADELVYVTGCFVENQVLPLCLELFFKFPWNNFLHSVVYDMIAKVFNTYSFTLTFNASLSNTSIEKNSASTLVEEKMERIKKTVRLLVISIYKDGELMKKIIDAQIENDAQVNLPKGVRLGYMGHLTYISDEVCKLIEKCSTDLESELYEYFSDERWENYKNKSLNETKERDCQPLGGQRPNQSGGGMMSIGGAGSMMGGSIHSIPLLTGGNQLDGDLDASNVQGHGGRFLNEGDFDDDDISGELGGNMNESGISYETDDWSNRYSE